MTTRAVDRRTELSRTQFVREYLLPRRPVVLVGAARQLPALRRWTWAFLARKGAATRVTVSWQDGTRGLMQLTDYLSYLQHPERYSSERGPAYLKDWSFEQELPELDADVPALPVFGSSWLDDVPRRLLPRLRWVYMGPTGTGSAMHQDILATHAWLAHLRGTKHWLLAPPDDDPNNPTHALETLVQAGDVIFVPSLWWHRVQNLSASLSLTVNYLDASNFTDVWTECERTGRQEVCAALAHGLLQRAERSESLLEEERRCIAHSLEFVLGRGSEQRARQNCSNQPAPVSDFASI